MRPPRVFSFIAVLAAFSRCGELPYFSRGALVSNFRLRFRDLEQKVYKHWNVKNPDHMASAAVAALSEDPDLIDFDAAECLAWALAQGEADLPTQTWLFDFGQPAITVVRNDDFRIDILYWLENASPTHDHITCGAFAAVLGDRLHGIYEFDADRDLDPNVRVGSLRRNHFGVMRERDVCVIQPEFIHDVFWLGRPTVTLVVRCSHHPDRRSKPRDYIGPGLAVVAKSNQETSRTSRLVEGLGLLRKARSPRYLESLQIIFTSPDATLAYYAFFDAAVAAPDSLDAVLERIQSPSALIERLLLGRDELVRRSFFGGLYTNDPDAQLAAGLLWADPECSEASTVIKLLHPGADPAAILDNAAVTYDDLSAEAAGAARAMARRLSGAVSVG